MTRMYLGMCSFSCIQALHIHTLTHKLTRIHTHSYAYTLTCMHTYTHTHTLTHTHAHTHTHFKEQGWFGL